jgi:hypothetical protein
MAETARLRTEGQEERDDLRSEIIEEMDKERIERLKSVNKVVKDLLEKALAEEKERSDIEILK